MNIDPAHAQAFIINPLTGRKMQFANLFRTHPPTEDPRRARPPLPRGRQPGGVRRRACGRQSRKFVNWSGMPKSWAFSAAITACRSSRFLPVTRT